MAAVPIEQVIGAAHSAGWKSADLLVAVAIAIAESGLDRSVVGGPNKDGTHDYGLWQINSVHKPTDAQKTGILANAQIAHKVYVDAPKKGAVPAGTNFTPWATYNDGKYKAHLPKVMDAMAKIGGPDYAPPFKSVDGNDKVLADSMAPKVPPVIADIPGAIAAAANSFTAQLGKMAGTGVAVAVAVVLLVLGVLILMGKPALAAAAVVTPAGKVAKLASSAAGTGGAHR